jgi:hypothetical protein
MTCAIAHVESWASTIRSINAMSSFHLLMVPSLAPAGAGEVTPVFSLFESGQKDNPPSAKRAKKAPFFVMVRFRLF